MTIRKAIKNLNEIIELTKNEIKNNDKNVSAVLDLEDLKSLKVVLEELEITHVKQLYSYPYIKGNPYIKGKGSFSITGGLLGYDYLGYECLNCGCIFSGPVSTNCEDKEEN